MSGIQKTIQQALAYKQSMENLHNQPWLVCRTIPGTQAAEYGSYFCIKASERHLYEDGGAEVIAA